MRVAGALLAAGASRRFGRAKAFVDFRGTSLVRHLAGELAAVAAPLLVIAAPRSAGALALELRGLGARIVLHRRAADGMGSSIAAAARALAAIAPEADALLLVLVDQPLADRALCARLIEEAGGGRAACDYGGGVVGPPALFPRADFAALAALAGDRGARAVLFAGGAAPALVPFAGGALDLDTPGDYERLLAAEAGCPEPSASASRSIAPSTRRRRD
jgi:molybdenum cofactor cytidylyltransferase